MNFIDPPVLTFEQVVVFVISSTHLGGHSVFCTVQSPTVSSAPMTNVALTLAEHSRTAAKVAESPWDTACLGLLWVCAVS